MQSMPAVNGHAVLELSPEERRTHKRKPVLWAARVETRNGPADCIILDLSLGGAKLRAPVEVSANQPVMLVIDRFGALRAEVVWARKGHMGLRFVDAPETVAHVIGTTLPLSRDA
ncbi:MAG TPA: PilZ domain-containing protein [Stellaceae bacterium]|nr:PilZ domain-containing protein [Stellaceae bacterium]